MTQQQLAERMRKTRMWSKLNCIEQAVYHELISIWHEARCKEVFTCCNAKLCDNLRISDPTLRKARSKLIWAKLIYYQSGKADRTSSSYSFTTPFDELTGKADLPVTGKGDLAVTGKGDFNLIGINKYIYPLNPPRDNASEIDKDRNKIRTPVRRKQKETIPIIAFGDIKQLLLADQLWKEQTAMQSGLSIDFLALLPGQIDNFLQYITAIGEEHTVLTLSDAKRRFFWWWKNQGKKEYEEDGNKRKTLVW